MALVTGSSCARHFTGLQILFHMLLQPRFLPFITLLTLAEACFCCLLPLQCKRHTPTDQSDMLIAAQLAVSAFSSSS